ncbi:Calcyphosin-2 [Oopsacas minuta]|uniref:Calcyphosin-2 n=1 Tax=Oopsacas minuta TaxID=111878 RepID=A0AAV7K1W7_9METZ|nr:Calcyphosin-2 [Oopsacas minuta]
MSFFDLSVTGTAPKWAARQPVIVSRPPIKPPSFSVHPSKAPFYNRNLTQGYHPPKHVPGTTQQLMNYTNQLMGAAKEYSSQNKNKTVHIDKEINIKPDPLSINKQDVNTNKQDIPTKQKKPLASSKVKPYRATRSRRAPQGVPKLNLSQLCEPDEEMMPIQLIPSRKNSESETVRSWGSPETLRKDKETQDNGSVQKTQEQVKDKSKDKPIVPLLDLAMLSSTRKYSHDTLTDIESIPSKPATLSKPNLSNNEYVNATKPKLTTAWGETNAHGLIMHENRKLYRFTEEVLDQEMGKQSVSAGTRSDSYLSFQNSIPTTRVSSGSRVQPSDLSKRLRFGARILSRRGRDSARELCGFYFVGDNTMTIYEFRQFGQRSSALPFLQRRPYRHLIGELRDDQVLVGDIFSGLTLCFSTANQPSLPDPLKRYTRLYLRITQVDEKSKEELKQYLNGEEVLYRRSLLRTTYDITNSIQNSIWSVLSKRSPKSLINFGRYLLTIDTTSSGYLSKGQLLLALKTFHLSLTPDQFQSIWDLSSGMETGGRVSHEQFRRLLLGGLPDERRVAMRVVLVKLDANKTGEIQLWQMKKFFCTRRHPDVLEGKLTEEQCYSDFFSAFYNDKYKSPDILSYAELEDYYEFVSHTVEDDTRFKSILKNCWGI